MEQNSKVPCLNIDCLHFYIYKIMYIYIYNNYKFYLLIKNIIILKKKKI